MTCVCVSDGQFLKVKTSSKQIYNNTYYMSKHELR